MANAITVNDLSFSFDDDISSELEHIDLNVNQGEIVCLIGPSGCGKSTLLRLISGVLTPKSGQILINDAPIATHHTWADLSFVPQDALLLPWRTVRDNVQLPLELSEKCSLAERRERAHQVLKLVNLPDEDKYPHQLSGGMRQRAALARALVDDSKILLLDEPFAALDAITRNQLLVELLRIRHQTGISVLMVTHNIFEAVFLADRVIIMSEKPGYIIDQISINLEQPRDLKIMGTPQFSNLVGKIQNSLEKAWGEQI